NEKRPSSVDPSAGSYRSSEPSGVAVVRSPGQFPITRPVEFRPLRTPLCRWMSQPARKNPAQYEVFLKSHEAADQPPPTKVTISTWSPSFRISPYLSLLRRRRFSSTATL